MTIELSSTADSVAMLPDARRFHVGSKDKKTRLFTIDGTLEREFVGHVKGVTGLAVLPDGVCFLSCSDDSTVRMVDVPASAAAAPVAPSCLASCLARCFVPKGRSSLL